MKITAKIAAMTLMAAMVGVAAEPKQPQQKLTVYLRDNATVPPEVRAPALDLANKMFATIGIRLEWRGGEPPRTSATRSIGIELATNTPADLLPGALGSAMPYEGVHIRVFYDRIRSDAAPRSALLAHVLVHEIAHIVQGTDQHSNSGVMKAVWTHQDHVQMRTGALPFTPGDIELIRLGLAARASGAPTLAARDLMPAIAQ
ncbi:MAG TPA: hypothetical protein VK687_05710 [Bryobacteraceae bacterium]|nr:hypothetical protein [Bryobacteraceae bacterium]